MATTSTSPGPTSLGSSSLGVPAPNTLLAGSTLNGIADMHGLAGNITDPVKAPLLPINSNILLADVQIIESPINNPSGNPADNVSVPVTVNGSQQTVNTATDKPDDAAQEDVTDSVDPNAPPTEQTDTQADTQDVSSDLPDDENMIVVTAPAGAVPGDPIARINTETFKLTQDVDEALVAPITGAYEDTVPRPIRSGLRNFLRNLSEPVNFLNYLLQLKPGKALETLGRFTINTTIGVGGVFDVAKGEGINLPYRQNGFANTLGFYGVKSGAYLYLPLIGSTSVRDLIGRGLDLSFLPALGRPFSEPAYAISSGAIRSLNDRIDRDDQITRIRNESADPYAETRDLYLKQRQLEIDILRGRAPDPLSRKNTPVVSSGDSVGDNIVTETIESPSDASAAPGPVAPEPVAPGSIAPGSIAPENNMVGGTEDTSDIVNSDPVKIEEPVVQDKAAETDMPKQQDAGPQL